MRTRIILGACLVMAVLSGLYFLLLVPWMRSRDEERRLGEEMVRAMGRLRSACKMIVVAEAESGEAAPTELVAMVEWVQQHVGDAMRRELNAGGEISRDVWGKRIVLVADDGRLSALASAGPNGVWESGRGDDVVVRLDSVRGKGKGKKRRSPGD